MKVSEIVEQFKQKEGLLSKNDTASVPLVIDQSRLLVQLRTKARKNWEKVCEEKLKIAPRVARRYVKIGEKWSTADLTPGPDLYETLPYDLHKLEALCELSLDQLKQLSRQFNLRKMERTEVIGKVNAMLGKQTKTTSQTSPVVSLLTKWDSFVDRMADEVKKLDNAGRQQVEEELETLFAQLRDSLEEALTSTNAIVSPASGEQDDDEDQEVMHGGEGEDVQDDGGESVEEAAQEQKEVPAQKSAPASKGGQPVGRQGNKPQPA